MKACLGFDQGNLVVCWVTDGHEDALAGWGRAHAPVFDTVRLCRNTERAYAAMIERSRTGRPPVEIDVPALPDT